MFALACLQASIPGTQLNGIGMHLGTALWHQLGYSVQLSGDWDTWYKKNSVAQMGYMVQLWLYSVQLCGNWDTRYSPVAQMGYLVQLCGNWDTRYSSVAIGILSTALWHKWDTQYNSVAIGIHGPNVTIISSRRVDASHLG